MFDEKKYREKICNILAKMLIDKIVRAAQKGRLEQLIEMFD